MPTNPDELGVFESCEGPDADIVGVYTNKGVVSTFYQDQTKYGDKLPPPKSPQSLRHCSAFASGLLQGTLKNPYANAGMAGAHRQSMHSQSVSTFSSSSTTSSMPTSTSSSTASTSQGIYPPISSNSSNASPSSSSVTPSSTSTTSSPMTKTTNTHSSESSSERSSPFGSVDVDAGVSIHPTASILVSVVVMLSLFITLV